MKNFILVLLWVLLLLAPAGAVGGHPRKVHIKPQPTRLVKTRYQPTVVQPPVMVQEASFCEKVVQWVQKNIGEFFSTAQTSDKKKVLKPTVLVRSKKKKVRPTKISGKTYNQNLILELKFQLFCALYIAMQVHYDDDSWYRSMQSFNQCYVAHAKKKVRREDFFVYAILHNIAKLDYILYDSHAYSDAHINTHCAMIAYELSYPIASLLMYNDLPAEQAYIYQRIAQAYKKINTNYAVSFLQDVFPIKVNVGMLQILLSVNNTIFNHFSKIFPHELFSYPLFPRDYEMYYEEKSNPSWYYVFKKECFINNCLEIKELRCLDKKLFVNFFHLMRKHFNFDNKQCLRDIYFEQQYLALKYGRCSSSAKLKHLTVTS